jgi:hydroxypyruvate isomerase
MLAEVGHPNTAILYDVYHAQRAEVVATVRDHLRRIEHIELADSPDRHQPGTGEINVPFLLSELAAAGYEGWICPEYRPLGGTEASLAWMREWVGASGSHDNGTPL